MLKFASWKLPNSEWTGRLFWMTTGCTTQILKDSQGQRIFGGTSKQGGLRSVAWLAVAACLHSSYSGGNFPLWKVHGPPQSGLSLRNLAWLVMLSPYEQRSHERWRAKSQRKREIKMAGGVSFRAEGRCQGSCHKCMVFFTRNSNLKVNSTIVGWKVAMSSVACTGHILSSFLDLLQSSLWPHSHAQALMPRACLQEGSTCL